MEKALSRVADEDIAVVAAGRTDTGVHGLGQMVHFDTTCQRQPHQWLRGTNRYLPDDISLLWTQPVASHFHARFSALERTYRYVILNRPVAPSHLSGRVTWHPVQLDVELMQRAARYLRGRHDFSAFRATSCQSRNPVKDVRILEVNRSGEWVWMDVVADGFLHHMVRNIAGVLMRIGERLETIEWAGQVLSARQRTHAGVTAAADGLYFVAVRYDGKYLLPPAPAACRFW